MDKELLLAELNNNPNSFWDNFKKIQGNDETELLYLQVLYESKANIPNYYLAYYQEIIEKYYSLIPCRELSDEEKNNLLIKALDGKRNILYFINIKSYKHYLFAMNFGDVTKELQAFINRLAIDILKNMNPRHFQEFFNYLIIKGFNYNEACKLSFQIYHVLGYFKGRDVLKDLYGEISKSKIKSIFGSIDLTDVVYDLDKLEPILNTTIINILLGSSYHISNTPLKRFIQNDNDENITFFLNNLNLIISNWYLILEEYTKRSNLEALKLKLNINQIKVILESIIDTKREIKKKESFRGSKKTRYDKIPNFEIRDLPLLESDLFDYIGTFNKYVTNPRNAPYRALELSRMMENVQSKKFPQINFSEGKYRLFTFHPQDRDLISAGFRTNNCFVPQGQGDTFGEGPSLLSYCISTPYGGGIEIRDNSGKTLAFSPILRNGNVLMLHSIEGIKLTKEERALVTRMLKKWANEVIKISESNEDEKIIAVTSAEDYYLDTDVFPETVPDTKRFHIYDPTGEYKDIYTGLSYVNHILAMHNDCSVDDIKYDYEVNFEYSYTLDALGSNHKVIEFTSEELEIIKKRNDLKDEIIEYTNARRMFLKNHQDVLAMEMLRHIKELQEKSILLYREIFNLNSEARIDKYKEFCDALDSIKAIYEKIALPMDFDIYSLNKIHYSDDWFIAADYSGELHYECIEGAGYQFLIVLNDIKKQQLERSGSR